MAQERQQTGLKGCGLNRNEQICDLCTRGFTYQAIGKSLGISRQRVQQIAKRQGVRPGSKWDRLKGCEMKETSVAENKGVRFRSTRRKTDNPGEPEHWVVEDRSRGTSVALIFWCAPRRLYGLVPSDDRVWENGCLKAVIAFLRDLNQEQQSKEHQYRQL